jgi:hypothetical protein
VGYSVFSNAAVKISVVQAVAVDAILKRAGNWLFIQGAIVLDSALFLFFCLSVNA